MDSTRFSEKYKDKLSCETYKLYLYKSISAAVTLADGPNTIILRHDGDNTEGVNLDYMELTSEQAISPQTDWQDYAFDDASIYYSPGILTNINGSWNETI